MKKGTSAFFHPVAISNSKMHPICKEILTFKSFLEIVGVIKAEICFKIYGILFQLLIFELEKCEVPDVSFLTEPKIIGEPVFRF